MTARILVVDDIAANVKLLEARLMAEYFQVLTAMNGPDALQICETGQIDLVLLDIMMPGMDGFEVCTRLKANQKTAHLPVIMVTALDQPEDRVRGLEAGADDFLTKPVSDIALITRVKSLVRLKMLTDELRLRASSGVDFGLEAPYDFRESDDGRNARILVVDDRPSSYDRIVKFLGDEHTVTVVTDPQEALFRAADEDFATAVISLSLADYDGLRLCSHIRSLERTRMLPIVVVAENDQESVVIRGLDLGVNDYVRRPIDRNELLARVRTQVRRKRFNEKLRDSLQATLAMAITDGLTGLHNRHYFDSHLPGMFEKAVSRGKPVSIIMCGDLARGLAEKLKLDRNKMATFIDMSSCYIHSLVFYAPQLILASSICKVEIWSLIQHSYYSFFCILTVLVYFMGNLKLSMKLKHY